MKTIRNILLLALLCCLSALSLEAKIKVACIGNSITENAALSPSEKYPAVLQQLIGNEYEVRNYGIGARTMLKKGNHPYWIEDRYKEVLTWNPDIVIIKMGTNDGKPSNWQYKDEFESDYIEFVNSFKSLPSKPKVYVCYPIPTVDNNFLPLDDKVIVDEIIPRVKAVAKKTKSTIIDLHTPMVGHEDMVYDKVHPNTKGTKVMARVVAKAICPKRNFPKPAIGKKIDLVFIGNSITEGTYLQSPPPTIAAMYLDSLGYEVRYANCGISGFTTVDFQPAKQAFAKIVAAADSMYREGEQLVFSMKLGTNDSASKGPSGAPVSAEQYEKNVQNIINALHGKYPKAKIMIHYPLWYSPNTHNSAIYLQEGLDRLQTYMPVIESLAKKNSGFVVVGDKKGFDIFRKNYKKLYQAQDGNSGTFYLHPNAEGAKVLGDVWAKSIERLIKD